jgi:hypothetical protein
MRALCTLVNGGGMGYGQWMSYAIRIFEILNWTDLAGVNEVGQGVGRQMASLLQYYTW